MRLFDFGGVALTVAFLVGLAAGVGAITIGEPVDSDSTPRGVTVQTAN